MRCRAVLLSLALSGGIGPVAAQEISKPLYFEYLPGGTPLPVGRQEATERFHLYGDQHAPGYVDQEPRNGIDDARDRWLTSLAVRFAPWMVRNTIDFPMDWRRFVRQGSSFPLTVDRFERTEDAPRLAGTDVIDLRQVERRPCEALVAATDTTPDCRLLALLQRYAPDRRAAPRPESPVGSEGLVMYFDFPGHSPSSWNQEFEGSVPGTISRRYQGWARTFVHPFIAPLGDRPAEDPRYQLVLQYWFFYPYNDAGNIHEGDWEHINVVVTTRKQGPAAFSSDELAGLLGTPPAADEFVIREVQYYFHHWVFQIDYFVPNLYLPREAWQREVDSLTRERYGEKAIWAQTRRQAYLDEAETRLNTHPLVFIGGDNRGLQQLIAAPSRLGRASHGSYPFVALYKDVGPGGTGEVVRHHWDHFRTPPDSNAPETEPIVRLDNPDRIELLPDWERVLPLTLEEPAARLDWSWLVLPIRFGYPATKSPFAGIVRYAETGNLSIPGPPFNGGWNRVGTAPGYNDYRPHRLSAYFPADLQDNFHTGWGFFNLTGPTLVTLPGLDIAYRLLSAPLRAAQGRNGPAFFNRASVPFRIVGMSGGVSAFKPGDDWLTLFLADDLGFALIDSIATRLGSQIQDGGTVRDAAHQWVAGISLHLGRRVVSESSLRHSRSRLGFDIVSDSAPVIAVRGTLNFWEYVGSIRYNLLVESFEPFIKLGYGLSWYRLEDVTFDGNQLDTGQGRWIRRPSFVHNLLPNTWHLGAGIEYVPIRSVGGPDVGLKAEVAVHTHNLGTRPENGGFSFAQDTRIYRWTFGLGGTLSF